MGILHNILREMARNGMTDAEFCKRAGLSTSAVSEWRSGKTRSFMKHLPQIADALCVTVDDLLTGGDFMKGVAHEELIQAISDLDSDETREALEYVAFLRSLRTE